MNNQPITQLGESVHPQAQAASESVFLQEKCGHLLGEELQVMSAPNGGHPPLVWKSRIAVGQQIA
jgi:hypothetical protein